MKQTIFLACLLALILLLLFPPMAIATGITVGSAAEDRDSTGNTYRTMFDLDHPATGSGNITSVTLWLNIAASSVQVGTFYHSTPGQYTCRDIESLPGTVPAGSAQTYAVSLNIVTGDFLGVYTGSGKVELSSTGYGGVYWKSGTPTKGAASSYSFSSGCAISIHGIGSVLTEPCLPFGIVLTPEDVTDREATLRGNVTFDGNYAEFCVASLGYWSDIDEGLYLFPGNMTSNEIVEWAVEDLVPGQEYYTYLIVENEIGKVYSDPIMFTTDEMVSTAIPEPDTKVAEISNVYLFDAWTYGLKFNARMGWDGGLDSIGGFEYRVKGNSTWLKAVELSTVRHTGDYWFSYKYGLLRDTTYEYRAYAKNLLGTGYGDILEINTSGIVFPTPTPIATPGGIPGIPIEWFDWFTDLSSGTKVIIAILITIGGMILIGVKMPNSKAVSVVVIGWTFLATILFLAIGWYPLWIIILLGAIVGLGILIVLTGGHK